MGGFAKLRQSQAQLMDPAHGTHGRGLPCSVRAGPDDKHITTIDADGVALAAIQALYKLSQQKDVEIEQQQARIHDQQDQIDELRAAVDALQQRLGLEISDLRN